MVLASYCGPGRRPNPGTNHGQWSQFFGLGLFPTWVPVSVFRPGPGLGPRILALALSLHTLSLETDILVY